MRFLSADLPIVKIRKKEDYISTNRSRNSSHRQSHLSFGVREAHPFLSCSKGEGEGVWHRTSHRKSIHHA